jgi:hypothetical protein
MQTLSCFLLKDTRGGHELSYLTAPGQPHFSADTQSKYSLGNCYRGYQLSQKHSALHLRSRFNRTGGTGQIIENGYFKSAETSILI